MLLPAQSPCLTTRHLRLAQVAEQVVEEKISAQSGSDGSGPLGAKKIYDDKANFKVRAPTGSLPPPRCSDTKLMTTSPSVESPHTEAAQEKIEAKEKHGEFLFLFGFLSLLPAVGWCGHGHGRGRGGWARRWRRDLRYTRVGPRTGDHKGRGLFLPVSPHRSLSWFLVPLNRKTAGVLYAFGALSRAWSPEWAPVVGP